MVYLWNCFGRLDRNENADNAHSSGIGQFIKLPPSEDDTRNNGFPGDSCSVDGRQ